MTVEKAKCGWEFWRMGIDVRTVGLEDAENLVASHVLHLADSVRITQDHTNLGGREALLGELADLVRDIGGGELEPGGGVRR